ncbi:S8 family peptidase [Spirosoma sp. KNUC1025]|uniref:S8 family peptidase n=1 Tax=Spirosoma sp. KNUC1025 TaxID=2894082 RepID=UPI0038638D38|nr:S8 family peptidase [Spirosoma sp. KNUC1025]
MERNKLIWLLALLLFVQGTGFGQAGKYLVLLRDKANSPYSTSKPEQYLSARSIQRRQKQNIAVQERDLPVNPSYITQLQQAGAKIWYTSRWLNAVLVEADDPTIAAVQKLSFVKGLEFNRSLNKSQSITQPRVKSVHVSGSARVAADTLSYGISANQIKQIGVDKMHQQGFHGEGMLIGVLDAGFLNADKVGFLKPVFDEKRILATYDFVNKETSVYEDDAHGLEVLSAIAATVDGQLYGTAYKASFILLRTEDAPTEKQVEEANWLFGAEYADSAGVDVISSSLGYTEFDDISASYTYQNLDGKTALSTRAAQIATETGMVVVVAAGNEGSDSWHYLSAPSDAVSVLAIGAVTQTGQRASFSSFGPSADGRVKPDLAARGQGDVLGLPTGNIGLNNGTSFAAPLAGGLAAGFWQAYPALTAAQVTEALRRSGSQYATPDDQLGYGIPNFDRAATVAKTFGPLAVDPATIPLLAYPNPFSSNEPLTIQLEGISPNTTVDASITDISGRVLWQKRFTGSSLTAFVLPNLGLSAGSYVMTFVAGDKKRTLRVVKQ